MFNSKHTCSLYIEDIVWWQQGQTGRTGFTARKVIVAVRAILVG